ncbi:MAG: ion transporter [Verrucomicrobiota bacterium JB024]|nr:ion transporter [Verrucomicrobiota bacterium JB024]
MIRRDERGHVSFGKWDYLIQALIILSLISFAFETLPDLDPVLRKALSVFEIFSVLVFSVEYVIRLSLSRPPRAYALSFLGIADLLAILPFYLGLGLDLRALRGFRLLRLFRIFKLVRYSRAMQRYHRAFLAIREELVLFTVTAFILMYMASVGIYYFERDAQPDTFGSVFHCMWWAIVTLTTVGYGDAYPITVGGRVFTFVILMMGLGVVAVPTGLFASALSQTRRREEQEDRSEKS